MLRLTFTVVLLFTLAAIAAQADQVKGKIKAVAADKDSVTLTVGKTDQQLTIPADAKVLSAYGKELPERLKNKIFQAGVKVVVTTEKVDGKDIVKEIRLLDAAPPQGYLDAAEAGPDFAI